jgi:hypothetical protein
MKNKKQKTAYGVFIIESVKSTEFTDGENLHQILELCDIVSVYSWADTIEDLERHLADFKRSQFRYLHLSCHADNSGIFINEDKITNEDLANMLKGGLENKRVFMSACKGANRDLASRLISECRAYSLIGTPLDLPFTKSAVFWPSFYHVMNENDQGKMRRQDIKYSLKDCVDLFNIPINYYSRLSDSNYIRRLKIRAGRKTDNRKIKVKEMLAF